jgi:hypothetical protein
VGHARFFAGLGVGLLLVALSCGKNEDTCIQFGPPQGFPLAPLDVFIAAGYPSGQPLDAFYTSYGAEYAGAPTSQYPEVCYSAYDADRANYRFIGWVDDFSDVDGGLPPWNTYCADVRDAGCAPQPGQLHGEVVLTLHEGEKNLVIIPLSR